MLYAQRWEQLISMRSQIDQVQVVAWNDYGESSYVGPVSQGDMPADAKSYANGNCE
jgi:glucan endo-1,3-alpha-glucosidase